jgi:histidinol phosphatase-like PHP family hydrolase
MDNLVAYTVRSIETQPIDVLANVMVLPKGFSATAEILWTEARMQRVIAAAAKQGVAFEINPRLRTPSEQFIKLAKAAGVKFTIGSDDTTVDNYTDWSYLLEIQQKAGLAWRNMWVPGHEPTRAQRARQGSSGY